MKPRTVAIYAVLVAGSLIMLFPLWWMVCVSFSTPAEASAAATTAANFNWWPDLWNWRNYPDALAHMGATRWYGFLDAFANTVVVTVLSVVGQVLSCSLVGYAFARLRFRGRGPLFVLMISTMMLPAQVTMIPMFILFRWFGWIDTILPLVVPMFFGTPFYIHVPPVLRADSGSPGRSGPHRRLRPPGHLVADHAAPVPAGDRDHRDLRVHLRLE